MNKHVITVTLNPAIDKTVTIDKFNIGGLNRVKDLRIDAGGKGINVAKVLNKFGINVVAAGLNAGVQGEILINFLKDEKVRTEFIKVQGDTRTNLKIVEESSNETTEVNESGFTVQANDVLNFKNKLSELLSDASYMVLGGSLPNGIDNTIYYELTELAKAKGVKTILDADGQVLAEGIKAAPFAVKPNLEELEKLKGNKLGTTDEIVSAAKELQVNGIEMVIVSMGGDGSIVVDSKEVFRAKTFPIIPKSTVGAGDSMVAVLVYSLINGYSTEKTAKLITAAGTITASKSGTQVCSLDEVMNSFEKVQVEKL